MDSIVNFGADDNRIASLIAFFLSKYDKEAVAYLGYATFSAAYNSLADLVNSKPNYIKLRRDEFDVFFPNNSRQGWNKRNPTPAVVRFFTEFDIYSFEELGRKIKLLIEFCKEKTPTFSETLRNELLLYSEKEIEDIINFKDDNASIKTIKTTIKKRLLNYKIVPELKQYYNYRCQICGQRHYDIYNVNITEAHHIDPFITSHDNSISNLIILCPNHHRLMHIAKPEFKRSEKLFIYNNGFTEQLTINDHL
ncbi:MAG TPA: hypothetical protein PK675_01860 [Clostridia bacterium]|nr:hypothetical protein [Clostridia bacterium]